MISPTILAVVIAVFAGLAFTGGFVVSDWRSASHIQQLGSENAMLSAVNDKCTVDIQSVHKAMDELATLVRSFNEMTSDLESNAKELEARRRFTEAILESIPTGVISVSDDGRIEHESFP